ncbi:MAG TPA: amidohydrolase family protein [Pseudomonadota bacterium]|nr:amidohydrolase family protein [Pseudomonadota bacterium]
MGVGRFVSLLFLLGVLFHGEWTFAKSGLVVVKAGQLLDVRTGKLLAQQALLIEDGRIKEVGPQPTLLARAPTGATIVDLGDHTVLPGLIDAHTHLTYRADVASFPWLGVSAPREALFGARHARITLLAGFTTVRNLGARGFSDVALRDAIVEGDVLGPRMVVSGPSMGSTGGHMDSNLLPAPFRFTEEGVADGPEGIVRKVREIVKYGADVIKVAVTGGFLSVGTNPNSGQYSDQELAALVSEAKRLGKKVAAHAHGTAGIKQAVRAGVDSIEHGTEIDDECIQLMKSRGTFLVPTVFLWSYFTPDAAFPGVPPEKILKAYNMSKDARTRLSKAVRAGVKIAFGTDSSVYPHGLNGHEFAALLDLGMTPLGAIQAATINAAALLGWEQQVGQLQPGFYADLVAVPTNPLLDVRVLENIPFVMKGGEIVKDERTPKKSAP